MERDRYQGFEITAEAERAPFGAPRASTGYAYAYREGSEDAVFAVAMTVEDRFAWSETGRGMSTRSAMGPRFGRSVLEALLERPGIARRSVLWSLDGSSTQPCRSAP